MTAVVVIGINAVGWPVGNVKEAGIEAAEGVPEEHATLKPAGAAPVKLTKA